MLFKDFIANMSDNYLVDNGHNMICLLKKAVSNARENTFEERQKAYRDRSTKQRKNRENRKVKIDKWAKSNLSIGDIVKVSSNANTPFRRVEELTMSGFRGRHLKHSPKKKGWFNGDYITHHLFDKITGVEIDNKIISIMKYIDNV